MRIGANEYNAFVFTSSVCVCVRENEKEGWKGEEREIFTGSLSLQLSYIHNAK